MGAEFFPVLERLEELGIAVDVAAGEIGPYNWFYEESLPRQDGGGEALARYEYHVTLTIDDAMLEDYDGILIAPSFAHSFWVEPGANRAIELLHEAASQGIPLGGMSYGVWVLLDSGILDGRTACNWPHPQGIVKPELHWSGYLSKLDVEFVLGCVHTDYGTDGQSPIVTANYKCPAGFAEAIAELVVSPDIE